MAKGDYSAIRAAVLSQPADFDASMISLAVFETPKISREVGTYLSRLCNCWGLIERVESRKSSRGNRKQVNWYRVTSI